eukprot:TRINITY_DN7755_c0_g1_i1.p1 TRINITY_DN7755_c0_g1~~TRINITY_DN7755_c0_g1_i1.p1  ORF type:complete len:273 (-),score=24.25 TRINITY_DN7755_c0_g1_i1:60-878(-)
MLCQTEELLASATQEIKVFTEVAKNTNPNILSLVDHCICPSNVARGSNECLFLLPFYKHGTLQDAIDNHRRKNGLSSTRSLFTPNEALTIFRGICNGVLALHSYTPPLVHRDLKPANVLLSKSVGKNPVPVIMDFGSVGEARVEIKDHRQELAFGVLIEQHSTPQYRPPELFHLSQDKPIDERTDVWTLGCILFCMIFNRSPFEDSQSSGSVALAVLSDVRYPPAEPIWEDSIQLIKSLLKQDLSQRPFLPEVISRVDVLLNSTSVGYKLPV